MKENKIEKLILDLSDRWECTPQEAVDRLNSMNESEINKLINSMTKKFNNGGMIDCLRSGGKTYAECKKCGGKTPIVKNQEPAGKMENTVLPRYAKIVEQGWNDPRYTFLSDINGGALSTVTPNNIHSYDGMMYATEQVANPWGQYVNQMNRMAGLPEEKRIYRKPDFRLMTQQNDLGQSVPIAYPMDFIDSKFDYNKAANELSEKQTKIRTQKKACGGPLPKKSKFKK